jgi:peptidoglycan endopeptidase LytE
MKKTSLHLFAPSGLLLLCFFLLGFASVSEAALEYKVKKGDSLYGIAKKYHVKINDLKNANSAVAKNIKPGDRIIVPSKKKGPQKKTRPDEPERDNVSYKKPSGKDRALNKTTGPSETPAQNTYHVVKKGDTLFSISSKYSISVTELKELNDLRKSTKLKKGQKLLVKSSRPKIYTVKKGDNIWEIAKKYSMDAEQLMEINEMDSPSLIKGQKLYLEEDQSVIAELQNNEILTKEIEEELKKMPESDEFVEKSMREKLTLFAKKLINIPYKFGGNSILGIDCSAYVKKVYGLLGIDLPRTAREQFNEGETIEKEELSIGDLVFFRTYASFPSHVGIYLGNDLFIHASEKGKKVKVDSLEAPYFVKRFIGAKRLLSDENKVADPQS